MSNSIKNLIILCFILTSTFCISSTFASFSFNIENKVINLGSKNQSSTARIKNTSSKPIAVNLTIKRSLFDNFGQETHDDIGNDLFSIYPSQLILMPGESEFVQINWLGPTDLKSELMFRLIAREQALDLSSLTTISSLSKKAPGSSGEISVIITYQLSLYVKPKNSKPNLELRNTEFKVNNVGDSIIRFVLTNNGNAHVKPKNVQFYITNNKTKEDIEFIHSKFVTIMPDSQFYFDFVLDKDQSPRDFGKYPRFTYDQ